MDTATLLPHRSIRGDISFHMLVIYLHIGTFWTLHSRAITRTTLSLFVILLNTIHIPHIHTDTHPHIYITMPICIHMLAHYYILPYYH